MIAYSLDLFLKLAEVFPDAFDVVKTSSSYEYRPGPFGVESVCTGTETVNLAECILSTAQAITRGGVDLERGILYLDSFAGKAAQQQEIRSFLKNS